MPDGARTTIASNSVFGSPEDGVWRLTDMDYADDIALFSPSSEDLSFVLRILSKEASKVGMSISWTKTKAMMISPSSAITSALSSLPTDPLRQKSLPALARQQVL